MATFVATVTPSTTVAARLSARFASRTVSYRPTFFSTLLRGRASSRAGDWGPTERRRRKTMPRSKLEKGQSVRRSGALLGAGVVACAVAALGGFVPVQNPALVRVLIETELGEIEVELDAANAPVTAANFLRYLDAGRYKGGWFQPIGQVG